jgi:iron(III) transport system substrate-binding protein
VRRGTRSFQAAKRTLLFAAAAVAVVAVGGAASASATQSAKTPIAKASVRHEKTVTAPASLVQAAKKEGSVTFYTSAVTDQMKHVAAAFQAKYGITVNGQPITSGPLATRINAELSGGNVTGDVIDIADHNLTAGLADKNAFATLGDLPEFRTFPKHYKYKYFAIVSIQAFGVGYNSQSVAAGDLKTWKDIVNPKFKGRVTVLDPRTIPVSQAFFYGLEKKYGDDFIRQIAALGPKLQISSTPVSQDIASGEAMIGFPMNPSTLPSLKAAGAPVAIAQPSPTTGPVHYAAIMKSAPHPNAARLFMNYLLSNTGQAAYNGYGFGASPVSNIRGVPLPGGYYPPVTPPADAVSHLLTLLNLK